MTTGTITLTVEMQPDGKVRTTVSSQILGVNERQLGRMVGNMILAAGQVEDGLAESLRAAGGAEAAGAFLAAVLDTAWARRRMLVDKIALWESGTPGPPEPSEPAEPQP